MSRAIDLSKKANQVIDRKHMIRADRFNDFVPALNLRVRIQDQDFKIYNISDSGIAFTANNECFSANELVPVEILAQNDHVVFKSGSRIAWSRLEDGVVKYGAEFRNRLLPKDFLNAIDQLLKIEYEVESSRKEFAEIPAEFRLLVFEIKNFMRKLKEQVDELEESMEIRSLESKESLLDALDVRFGAYITDHLRDFGAELHKHLGAINHPKTRNTFLDFFRAELNEYYLHAPYARRAAEKPLGYAGDYEMMNQVYRNKYEGKSLFAKLIHRYTVNEAAAHSVRERCEILKTEILTTISQRKGIDRPIKICSIACGPAREIVEVIKAIPPDCQERIDIYLIDQDIEALLDARRNITTMLGYSAADINVHCCPIPVKELLEGSEQAKDLLSHKFDFTYSAGLYDYLLQPVAQFLTNILIDSLAPGGRLILANFHPSSPTRAICEFSVDWRLVYRGQEEMMNLVADTQKSVVKKSKMDDQGIVVYLELEKV